MAKLSGRKGENAFPKTVKLLKSTKNIPKVMVKLLDKQKKERACSSFICAALRCVYMVLNYDLKK